MTDVPLMTPEHVYANAQLFVGRVADLMATALASRDGVAGEAARYAIAAGGKRLRPVLVHAARPKSVAADAWTEVALSYAAAVELIHTASLMHDDMLDGAVIRRGRTTTHEAWDPRVATAAGDLLFATAFKLLVVSRHRTGDAAAMDAVHTLATVARILAEGEAVQAEQAFDPTVSLGAYRERCIAKTGVLFGAALRFGGLAGGAPAHDLERLEHIGCEVGLAFQIVDDMLDVAIDADAVDRLGKVPGADIRDGTMSAPLLVALEQDPELAELVRSQDTDVPTILHRIHATDALSRCAAWASQTVDTACEELDELEMEFDIPALRAVAMASIQRLA
jgi:geranylgeranyl pyrophosphate synthase